MQPRSPAARCGAHWLARPRARAPPRRRCLCCAAGKRGWPSRGLWQQLPLLPVLARMPTKFCDLRPCPYALQVSPSEDYTTPPLSAQEWQAEFGGSMRHTQATVAAAVERAAGPLQVCTLLPHCLLPADSWPPASAARRCAVLRVLRADSHR